MNGLLVPETSGADVSNERLGRSSADYGIGCMVGGETFEVNKTHIIKGHKRQAPAASAKYLEDQSCS